MRLDNLPTDILLIIMKQLDVISLYNLYRSYYRIRSIISTHSVDIKTCNLSVNVMAHTEILKSQFFENIRGNLQELNVRAMRDLDKATLLPAMTTLPCLTKLDVTYTNIIIPDLLAIYAVCPTIIDISINFLFGSQNLMDIDKKELLQLQEVFKNILYVHFVGHLNFMMLNLPFFMLQKAKLKQLQYTVIECKESNRFLYECDNVLVHFEHFILNLSASDSRILSAVLSNTFQHNDFSEYCNIYDIYPFCTVNFLSYEIFVIIRKDCLSKPKIRASHIFENFLRTYCSSLTNIDFQIIENFRLELYGNVCIMLWNKSLTKFDHKFFQDLWFKVKPLFPCYFSSPTNAPVPPDYNLYVTKPKIHTSRYTHSKLLKYKPIYLLNYDSAFRDESELQLSLIFERTTITGEVILSRYEYLNKLTYLSLCGHVNYNEDFFRILFECCDNLVTLSVNGTFSCIIHNEFCSEIIARSLPFSKSIKNLLVIDRVVYFSQLYLSMSQCKTLENVHIIDNRGNNFSSPSRNLFKNCKNLYCLNLYILQGAADRYRYVHMLRKLTSQQKKIIKLLNRNGFINDPYTNVFKWDLLYYNVL